MHKATNSARFKRIVWTRDDRKRFIISSLRYRVQVAIMMSGCEDSKVNAGGLIILCCKGDPVDDVSEIAGVIACSVAYEQIN